MLAIRDLLTSKGIGFYDAKLAWGAKASDYRTVIEFAHSDKRVPVLVELEVDFELPTSAIVIDHHGDRSNEPASLIQVMTLLDVTPSKWDLAIAANDSGYIPAMIAAGVDEFHINAIRKADRAAQGVTKEMEQQAEKAIAEATEGFNGMKVISLPHSKCSTVTDRLFTSWPDGKENLVILCHHDEYYYFGRGDICKAFKEQFAPNSWGGGKGYGDQNGNGFAGCRGATAYEVQKFFNNQ